jgi:hypothetical protein
MWVAQFSSTSWPFYLQQFISERILFLHAFIFIFVYIFISKKENITEYEREQNFSVFPVGPRP